MDFTSRLGLNKPNPDPVTGDFVDVSKLNENADKIDQTISFTVCLSTGRPATPFAGQAILETDTGKAYVWGGSAWLPLLIGNGIQIVNNLGVGTAPDATVARRIKTFWAGTMGGTSQVLLEQSGVAAGSRALGIRAGGEANERYWIDFDGKMQWGPGTAGGDVSLSRSAAGTIDVTGTLTVNGRQPGDSVQETLTVSGTWFKPVGAKRVWVRMVGGGGAGGGAASAASGQGSKGGGGGGGEYAEVWFNASSLSSSEPITVGSGGAGVSGAAGGSGGTTTFKGVSAAGGGGGGFSASNASNTFGISGGDGGTGGAGAADFRSAGGGGNFGVSGPGLASGGAGGYSVLGGGGKGTSTGNSNTSLQGDDAAGYGGGGGGGMANQTGGGAVRGGNGKAGVIIVTTFF